QHVSGVRHRRQKLSLFRMPNFAERISLTRHRAPPTLGAFWTKTLRPAVFLAVSDQPQFLRPVGQRPANPARVGISILGVRCSHFRSFACIWSFAYFGRA